MDTSFVTCSRRWCTWGASWLSRGPDRVSISGVVCDMEFAIFKPFIQRRSPVKVCNIRGDSDTFTFRALCRQTCPLLRLQRHLFEPSSVAKVLLVVIIQGFTLKIVNNKYCIPLRRLVKLHKIASSKIHGFYQMTLNGADCTIIKANVECSF